MKKQLHPTVVKLVTASVVVVLGACNELPTGPADTPAMRVRGVTLADWTANGYGRPSSLTAVDRIAGLGTNRLVIVVTAYQRGANDNHVRTDPLKTPTEAAVGQAAARALNGGLDVVVKLHVDLDSGEWRGVIRPRDIGSWFASYGAFVFSWAEWAADNDVRQLVIGTELAGTIEHEDRWRALVAGARSRFGGEVVYAASWDEAWKVPWWDAVDRVGVDFYAPVAERENAGRVEMVAGWQPWLDRLHLLHEQTGTPLLLTEVGYRSVDGAGMRPYEFASEAAADPGEQADLYWAALTAVGEKDWIEGLYWWNWLADGSGGLGNTDYTPQSKPAEGELAGAWHD
jgi:hypothetical protein